MEHAHIDTGKLAAYFDGELPHAERQAIAGHVAACGTCRQRLDEMAMTRIALHTLPAPAPPDSLWPALAQKLPAPGRPLRLRKRILPRLAVAASLLLAAIAGGLVLRSALNPTDMPQASTRAEAARPLLEASAPFDWGLYLDALDHGRSSFSRHFEVEPASLDDALRAAGVAEDFRSVSLPSALRLEQAYIVRRDGKQAAQLVYRSEGRPVVVFCQDRDAAVAFSGFIAEPTDIDEKPCYSVYCGLFRALSFSAAQSTYTVVAWRNDPMLAQVLHALSPN